MPVWKDYDNLIDSPEHYWPKLPTRAPTKAGIHPELLLSEALVDAKAAFKFAHWFLNVTAVLGSAVYRQPTHPKLIEENLIYDPQATIVGHEVVACLKVSGSIFNRAVPVVTTYTLSISEVSIKLLVTSTSPGDSIYEYSTHRGSSLPVVRCSRQPPGNVPEKVQHLDVEQVFKDGCETQVPAEQDWEI